MERQPEPKVCASRGMEFSDDADYGLSREHVLDVVSACLVRVPEAAEARA